MSGDTLTCLRQFCRINEALTDIAYLNHSVRGIAVGNYQLSPKNFVKRLCFNLYPEELPRHFRQVVANQRKNRMM